MEFRYAQPGDGSLVLQFIKDLADYENLLDRVTATGEMLEEALFVLKQAEVIFLMEAGQEVGFALFYPTFSTFLGRGGIHLEDLYVRPAYQGKGYGKALLKKLAQITVERKGGRLEWECLDWNQRSIDFYLAMGAVPMNDWTNYRLTGESLEKLAEI